MIRLENVTKGFVAGGERIDILKDASLFIKKGEKVAVVGPSGSGKTTLLSLIAGLDKPDSGKVFVGEEDVSALSKAKLAEFRNRMIGVVFQSFELIPPFTALENVMTPLDIAGVPSKKKACELLDSVGLAKRSGALPRTLSGGEKQRVAIARAMAADPQVILADEPTGSLDRVTGAKVIDLLLREAGERGATLVVITHDTSISAKMDRIIELRERKLYEN